MYSNEDATKRFVEFLIEHWNSVIPIRSYEQRNEILDTAALLSAVNEEATQCEELCGKGEYGVKVLLLIAKLLMVQEKTNREDSYMFRKLFEGLRDGKNIYKIVSTATFH